MGLDTELGCSSKYTNCYKKKTTKDHFLVKYMILNIRFLTSYIEKMLSWWFLWHGSQPQSSIYFNMKTAENILLGYTFWGPPGMYVTCKVSLKLTHNIHKHQNLNIDYYYVKTNTEHKFVHSINIPSFISG